MFLKTPKASTDQRVRSLLQKAARRGYADVVELALTRLDRSGDKTWLRSRTVVITFEECWPLAAALSVTRELSVNGRLCSASLKLRNRRMPQDLERWLTPIRRAINRCWTAFLTATHLR